MTPFQLATGTVTFLYTDIEGSTRRWEEHPAEMKAAVARHDALLRAAIASAEGTVFRTVGDGLCASFAVPRQGLAAAVAAQRALRAEPWGATGELRVRMALHTGEAELRDGDYVGASLNRVGRLLAAGHGGQILLSEATADLVRDALPGGTALRDLGEQRLRDLARPEHVHQLAVADLPSDFPALQTLSARPNNLPLQLTSFIGREREVAEIRERLSGARLLTLTGAGGTGKTRLAIEVAAELIASFTDGVWFVDLAPINEPGLVPSAVGAAVGVREGPGTRVADALAAELRDRQTLIVLDNCEHLIDACARLADTVLRGAPRVTMLATSREALGVPGEVVRRVPSLGVPASEDGGSPAELLAAEAVRLFVDRVRAARPEFELTAANAAAVGQICRRLDGIPLALELAAARVRSMAIEDVARRLDDRFSLLTGGSRTAVSRQQTLRALIDWSYDLLSDREHVLLRRLAVFVGGWTLDAAEAVCAGGGLARDEIADALSLLVDKSLVLLEEQDGSARYRMLESVREYARDRLVAAGEAETTRGAHREYFVTRGDEASQIVPRSDALSRAYVLEYENLRAALVWSLGQADADRSLRLAAGLMNPAVARGRMSDARRLIDDALARADAATRSPARARALTRAATLAAMQSDSRAARAYGEEAISILRESGDKLELGLALIGSARASLGGDVSAYEREVEELVEETGDRWAMAMTLFLLGDSRLDRGDLVGARDRLERSVAILTELGDSYVVASPLTSLARVALAEGDPVAANAVAERALAMRRASPDQPRLSVSLNSLGEIARWEGDLDRAEERFAEALRLNRTLSDPGGIAWSVHNLAHVALARGRHSEAARFFSEALTIRERQASPIDVAATLTGIAGLAAQTGRALEAARLFGAADESLKAPGLVLPPPDVRRRGADVAAARSALGADTFDAATAEGERLPLNQALVLARAVLRAQSPL